MNELTPIPEFPGYRITRDGRIWSLKSGRWLLGRSQDGYARMKLRRAGRDVMKMAHVLVAETFIGPKPDGLQVRHLNGNPADNRVENLAWGTSSENESEAEVSSLQRGGVKSRYRDEERGSGQDARQDFPGRHVAHQNERRNRRRGRHHAES